MSDIFKKLPLLLVGIACLISTSRLLPAQGLQTAALMDFEKVAARPSSAELGDIINSAIPWTLANLVWNDQNGNGVMDEDPIGGLSDIPVRLLDPVTGAVAYETATDVNGQYIFTDVEPNDYTVDVSDQVAVDRYGLHRTTPDFFSIRFEGAAIPPMSLGFGFGKQVGAVDGALWWDQNTNGVRDWGDLPDLLPGTDGLAFVTVRLADRLTGRLVAETITDSYGYYLLDGLEPGSYLVEVDPGDPDLLRQTGLDIHASDQAGINLLRSAARPTTPDQMAFDIPQSCSEESTFSEGCLVAFNAGFATAEDALVHLNAVQAQADGRSIDLHWSTTSEWDNERFDILHSYNYGSFSHIGSVPGAENSDVEQHYTYSSSGLRYGIHRYRIRQMGRYGSESYGPDIEVHLSMDGAFVLDAAEPDRYKAQNTVTFAVSQSQRVRVELHSDFGGPPRVLFEDDLDANEIKELSVDASNLVNGRYYVRIKGEQFEGARTVLLRR